jgi:DNA ligase (NAD+)
MIYKTYEDYIEEINNLIEMLNYNTLLYDEGKPVISDKEWDEMYFRLQYLENSLGVHLPHSPTQKVNYQFVTELKKVKHNHPMLSLDKTKDWNEFLHYFAKQDPSKSVVGM